jgi:hypothetical protein
VPYSSSLASPIAPTFPTVTPQVPPGPCPYEFSPGYGGGLLTGLPAALLLAYNPSSTWQQSKSCGGCVCAHPASSHHTLSLCLLSSVPQILQHTAVLGLSIGAVLSRNTFPHFLLITPQRGVPSHSSNLFILSASFLIMALTMVRHLFSVSLSTLERKFHRSFCYYVVFIIMQIYDGVTS